VLLWASNAITIKVVLREIDPLTLTWLRYAIAGLLYLPFTLVFGRAAAPYSRRERWLLFWAGVTVVPIFNLTLYYALSYTTAANASLVRLTEPAWVLLLAALVFGERASPRQLAGLGLALLGTLALVVLGRRAGGGEHHVLGMAFMVANSFAWIAYILCSKGLLRRHDAVLVTAHASLVGAAVLALTTGWQHGASVVAAAARLSPLGWALVIYMGVVVTVGSNLLFTFGLKRLTAGAASAYAYLIPICTALLAWMVLGEPITALLVSCGVIISAGVYLVNRA
jgi:drug/metabolite transporter (DMT)-like permease